MGAYAIFSGKPFVVKGELQKKRKKGVLDANMELLKNCKITVDTDRKTINVESCEVQHEVHQMQERDT